MDCEGMEIPKDAEFSPQNATQDQTAIFSCDAEMFRKDFTKLPFKLNHSFADSQLFTLPRLARAAEQLIEQGRGHRFMARQGQNDIGAGWGAMPTVNQVANAIESIGEQNSWMKVSAVNEADPEYVEFLDAATQQIEDMLGRPFRENITHAQMTAFISSQASQRPITSITRKTSFAKYMARRKSACTILQAVKIFQTMKLSGSISASLMPRSIARTWTIMARSST